MNGALFLVLGSAFLLVGCSGAAPEERACTPALANWTKPHPHLGPDRAMFRVALDRSGHFYLDGKKMGAGALATSLGKANQIGPPDPAFILETEMGAPCPKLDEVRRIMTRELKCGSGGHCDEGVMSVWENMEVTGAIP